MPPQRCPFSLDSVVSLGALHTAREALVALMATMLGTTHRVGAHIALPSVRLNHRRELGLRFLDPLTPFGPQSRFSQCFLSATLGVILSKCFSKIRGREASGGQLDL